MNDRCHLTLVLPCFNEASRITASLGTLQDWFGTASEIIVVDDGSEDDTAERAAAYAAARPLVRVLRLPVNAGKGAAIRTAVAIARGERVVLLDADLAYDRDSVERAIAGLDAADFVSGDRRHERSTYSVPVRLFGFLYRRHIVGLAFNLYVRVLLGLTARDTQCGLKAFRREPLLRMAASLSTDGFAQDVEMHLVAKALRLRYVTVPVRVTYESAASSVRVARSGASMGVAVLRLAGRRLRGRYSPSRVAAAGTRYLRQSEGRRETTQTL